MPLAQGYTPHTIDDTTPVHVGDLRFFFEQWLIDPTDQKLSDFLKLVNGAHKGYKLRQVVDVELVEHPPGQ